MTQPDSKKARRMERLHGRVANEAQSCNHPHCDEPGEFRAPAPEGTRPDFNGPGAWQWLCLDHVRAFNAGYNFFHGMSTDEIEAAQRPYAGWERETRAFSAAPHLGPRWGDFMDPMDAIHAHFGQDRMPRADGKALSDTDRKLLKVLELDKDADRTALRKRYSELVRRYHPDRNGGDRSHEKALQAVIDAYTQLKSRPAFA